MIKKALLVIYLLIAPNLVTANVFTNALNFICGGGSVPETWNGQTHTPDKNPYCPPYNKFGNRGGCLKQYTAPGLGTLFYMQYCAEEAPSSSYFNPKIQVRMQSCNPLACWALSSELNWDGECVLWPTPLLFPLQRLCARMAAPADNNASPATPADNGYTYFKHLNFEGAVVDDPRIPGTDGQSAFIVSPKTCAYWDPWAFDLFPVMPLQYIPFFDVFDYNPIKQPFHKNAGVHPLVQMMINLLEAGLNSSQMILRLIVYIEEASMGPIGMLVELLGDKTGLTKMIINMVSSVIKIVGEEVFVRILKEFGQLNHVVYDSNIGCVPVPMGPFPPPYPKQYTSAPPAPTIEAVCASTAGYAVSVTSTASNFVPPATVIALAPPTPPTGATLIANNGATDANGNTRYGFIVKNTDGSTTTTTSVTPAFIAANSSTKCATSTLSNNVINNVVRVGIDRIVPRCDLAKLSNSSSSTVVTSTTTVAANSCVTINGLTSARAVASNPAGIPSCANNAPAPCVAVTSPAVCPPTVCGAVSSSIASSDCSSTLNPPATCPTTCGYRVVYATQYVAGSTPLTNPYYDPSIPDCNGRTYPCQMVWGINAGPYTELVVPFPASESGNLPNTQTLVNRKPSTTPTATLCYNGQSYSFLAAISRTADGLTDSSTVSYTTAPNTPGSYTSVPVKDTGLMSQDPTKICVYTATDPSLAQSQGNGGTLSLWTLNTCLPRAPVPTPTVLNCCQPGQTTNCSTSCQASNFSPAMVVKLAVGSYSTQGILAANAFAANSNYTTTLNLAGYEYTASVTDKTFITPDKFPTLRNTTTHSPALACGNASNFASIFDASDFSSFATTPAANNGTYFGTSSTSVSTSTYLPALSGTHKDANGNDEQNCVGATIPFYITANTTNPLMQTGAIYKGGLVYVNNKYLVGGNYMCLDTLAQNTCATNTSNCVLASLENTTFFDCDKFNANVVGAYPNISYCNSNDNTSCSKLTTVNSTNGNFVTIYTCGTINPSKCYSYDSSNVTQGRGASGALCRVSSDPASRISPAAPNPTGSSPILTVNQYYDPSAGQASIASTISNSGTKTPPAIQDCGSYLNNVVDLNDPTSNPYIGISQCAITNPATATNATPLCTGSTSVIGTPPNPMTPGMCYNSSLQLPVCSSSAPIVESFTSTLSTSPATAVKLDVRNCYTSYVNPVTHATVGRNNYCYSVTYTPTSPPPATCQMNTSTVTRLTTSGNPAVGSSTLDCSTFIDLFGNSNNVSLIGGSPYANIAACSSSPSGSVITTFKDSSSSANTPYTVDIYQYSTIASSTSTAPVLTPPMRQLNYCYKPRAASSSCTLNRTNTSASRPDTIDCGTMLTLINANYKNIISCTTPPNTCASQSTLNKYATQNYANTASCSNPSSPTCTAEATIASATTGKNVVVKNCSYDTNITLNYASGESNTTTTTQNYYCYSYNGDSSSSASCSLATSDLTITPSSNPAPSTLMTQLPILAIPNVIKDINGAGATTATNNQPSPNSTRGIRSKTMLEQGLCADVPSLPNCAAITTASSSTNYAIWDAAAPGVQKLGRCMDGYIPISSTSLLRYCLINPENAKSGNEPQPNFEPLTAAMGCKPPTCPAVTTFTASDGYAIWKGANSDGSTSLSQQATGTCAGGTITPNGGLAKRSCELNSSNVATLSPINASTTCTQIPWQIGLIYPASGSLTANSDPNATATYYASNFLSISSSVSAYLSNTNVHWSGGGPTLDKCVWGKVDCTQTIFIPGPKIPNTLIAGQTFTMYINIPQGALSYIDKIAYIDNICSSNGNVTNCTWTSRLGSTHSGQLLGTEQSPPTIQLVGAQRIDSRKIDFGDLFDIKVTPANQSTAITNPGFGSYKWFGWFSGEPNWGGYDGWMIYSTTDIDENVRANTNTFSNGLNKVELTVKPNATVNSSMYPNGVGFWYIELKQSVFPVFKQYNACD